MLWRVAQMPCFKTVFAWRPASLKTAKSWTRPTCLKTVKMVKRTNKSLNWKWKMLFNGLEPYLKNSKKKIVVSFLKETSREGGISCWWRGHATSKRKNKIKEKKNWRQGCLKMLKKMLVNNKAWTSKWILSMEAQVMISNKNLIKEECWSCWDFCFRI